MTIQFQANFLIKGEIFCETGLHIGGTAEGIEIGGLENVVIREHGTDLPFIPGSSLKGKMRTLLELNDKDATRNIIQNDGKPCNCGKCLPCKIFGNSADERREKKEEMEGKQKGPTRLIVRDSFLIEKSKDLLKSNGTEVKYENTLNRITSEANPRAVERVPRGAVFNFEMVFSVYEEEDYGNFINIFQCMRLLEDSYLGGSGTRGSGQVKFKNISIVKRDLEYYKGDKGEKTIETEKSALEILANNNLLEKIKTG